jgi:hypothetical protein
VTRLARAVLLASAVVTIVAAALPGRAGSAFRPRRVVFVTIVGEGAVSSTPAGIDCPKTCRSAAFYKSERVRLVARARPGWRLLHWRGSCVGRTPVCSFLLVDSHDCAHGACPVDALGLRVTFGRVGGSG